MDGDFLTALLAQAILAKEPGAAILYDVRASRAVRDLVQEAGGSAHVNRVGHAFFKARMREEGAAFGGEVSGHYYFRDFYCADPGTLPALLILELLSAKGQKMSELQRILSAADAACADQLHAAAIVVAGERGAPVPTGGSQDRLAGLPHAVQVRRV